MKLAIATVCLSGDLGEKLEAIAAAGFKGVEIFENDLLGFGGIDRANRCQRAPIQPFRPLAAATAVANVACNR